MAQDIKLNMDGMLLNWLKSVGDTVRAGDVIAEFEADKATVEVEAPADGVILSLDAEIGAELEEGSVIGSIGSADEETAAQPESAPEPAAEAQAPSTPAEETAAAPAPEPAQSADMNGRVKASPIAKRMAEEKGIDLRQVRGSGPGGRIVKSDVENFDPSRAQPIASPAAPAQPAGGTAAAPAAISGATYGKLPGGEAVEILDISRMRRAIADATIRSKQLTPHFYITVAVDVEPLLALRKELNANLEDDGVKISVNDMMVKACAIALKKFPNLNSHYYGDKIVRHKNINIGIAVALPDNGLLNVVAHDADKMALSVLAQSNKEMFARAREGKPKGADLQGATFTISNLGPYGVDHFAAIISPPEAAILAVGSSKKVPIVLEDGTLGVGTRMNVTLSVDHRVSDGAEGAQFLQHLVALLENPMRLLV